MSASKLHFGGQYLRQARHRLIREAMLRDGFPTCYRCNGIVDPALSGLHPDGATVGHIVAVSQGGDDSYDNLALEHRRCNLRAGARPAPAPATVVEPILGEPSPLRYPHEAASPHSGDGVYQVDYSDSLGNEWHGTIAGHLPPDLEAMVMDLARSERKRNVKSVS